MDYQKVIEKNNATHTVNKEELKELLKQATVVYNQQFNGDVWFERSIFTNWTCSIADCKYCYLSTRPKMDKKAYRSQESILAEALLCKVMDWKVGYITGGLRVEPIPYMVELLQNLKNILGYKPMMNYGPYTKKEIQSFKDYVAGLGSAIESFDPELHKYICPSKPLNVLLKFLSDCQEEGLENFITIILGIGEKKEHLDLVIESIKKYNITRVQLCFLKPLENTVFENVPSPNVEYMTWWAAKLRVEFPDLTLKVALVQDRIEDFSLLLQAGVNCFSRYMVFKDFASPFAEKLEEECRKVNRKLLGNFHDLPKVNVEELMKDIPERMRDTVKKKFLEYYAKLEKLKN